MFVTPHGTYKTGRFQSSNQKWYGRVERAQMTFITKEEFEMAIKPHTPPPLDILLF